MGPEGQGSGIVDAATTPGKASTEETLPDRHEPCCFLASIVSLLPAF